MLSTYRKVLHSKREPQERQFGTGMMVAALLLPHIIPGETSVARSTQPCPSPLRLAAPCWAPNAMVALAKESKAGPILAIVL